MHLGIPDWGVMSRNCRVCACVIVVKHITNISTVNYIVFKRLGTCLCGGKAEYFLSVWMAPSSSPSETGPTALDPEELCAAHVFQSPAEFRVQPVLAPSLLTWGGRRENLKVNKQWWCYHMLCNFNHITVSYNR